MTPRQLAGKLGTNLIDYHFAGEGFEPPSNSREPVWREVIDQSRLLRKARNAFPLKPQRLLRQAAGSEIFDHRGTFILSFREVVDWPRRRLAGELDVSKACIEKWEMRGGEPGGKSTEKLVQLAEKVAA